jgi:UDP-N-acetylmuramoyl-tripeptide--D-alanyl-D-alanine ligase
LDVNIDHDHAIFELGARQSGDIKHLSSIIEPDFAVVTNIGHAHLETFGALENTAKVKFELASELKRSGTLVVNADCEHSMKMVSTLQERNIITFGTKGDLSFSNFKNTLNGSSFQISTKWGDAEVKLSLVGKHNAYNFLAAAAVALLNGVDLEELVERASSFTAVTGRMKKVTGMNESIIIDDTYNANPQSVSAAIHYLSEVKADHKIAVLGDMLELGSDSSNYHNEIGALSKKCGVARVLSLGKYSDDINKGFGDLANGYTDKQQLVEDLKNIVSKEKNSAILVKGSRNMNFETIVQELCEEKECLKRS